MASFYTKHGALVQLSNSNQTATRNNPAQEFNNGVVLSAEPLKNNQLFEVRIDKKIASWSGSIEIGVTTSNPSNLVFPTSATGFREPDSTTYVMSGSSILKDGHTLVEEYGRDLDQLGEGDRIGVLRTGSGALHFYVNGEDQGCAVQCIPQTVWAVVDMYGKCAQVTIVGDVNRETILQNEFTNEMIQEAAFAASTDKLIFHEKTGTLIKLTNGRRTAERKRPLDEFNNGVVMTNRGIRDDEMFEIRIDRLVDKWSGSIEVGITAHNPASLDFPATMTNMRTGKQGHGGGTIMMSGCGILTNGKGTRREYGDFNLDELQEGDRIGLMRKSSGALHYYINGQDQGVAATSAPNPAWGVVDLYGMAVKVTIIDSSGGAGDDPDVLTRDLTARTTDLLRQLHDFYEHEVQESAPEEVEKLLFHSHCGAHAAVMNGGKTAHRPNSLDDFNAGVVLTNRHLKPNEMFEVRLDKLIDKWAGSIEIGVTTHAPLTFDFPSTMTNIRSGTWMMTGNGVMHNGTTVLDDYGQNLDQLKVGDRVGTMRKEDGTLHFYVNGIDQGPGATAVPADVYGVIDLYGQAAQATIIHSQDQVNLRSVDPEPLLAILRNTSIATSATDDQQLRFHSRSGRNAVVSADGRVASRPNARGEFNDAIVITSRPLRDNELFEVSLDVMVDRWSGSIEAGVTLIEPEDLDLPNTMTDIDYDTWMLSGSAVMQGGSTIRNGYKVDLDTLPQGSRVGMMRALDGTLHFYLNGDDMGVACTGVPTGVYAVIDLYGQCAKVTITDSSRVIPLETSTAVCEIDPSLTSPISTAVQVTHRFSMCAGKNVHIKDLGMDSASRVQGFNNGLVFSTEPLCTDELFEVRIERVNRQWSGSLHIGVTSLAVSDSMLLSLLPASALQLTSKPTWVLAGSDISHSGNILHRNYSPSLLRLETGDKVGVMYTKKGDLHFYINGEDLGVAASDIPEGVFALVDIYGAVEQVCITSSLLAPLPRMRLAEEGELSSIPSLHSSSLEGSQEQTTPGCDADVPEIDEEETRLLERCGENIEISDQFHTACRSSSYNNGLVFSHAPLRWNQRFKIRIDKVNPKWSSGLQIGVMYQNPDKMEIPSSASNLQGNCWLLSGTDVLHNGVKIMEQYGADLDNLQEGHTVTIAIQDTGALHLLVNDVDQGMAVPHVPHRCHVVIDVYGTCQQISVMPPTGGGGESASDTAADCYKEKADMEECVKEKARLRDTQSCEYERLCSRFMRSLALPDGFFNVSFNRCFCDACHKRRGDVMYCSKGEPPRDVALPAGWCKFGLKVPPKAECLNVFEKWHTAYQGVNVSGIRRVLDTGRLMPSGDEGLMALQPQIFSRDEKNKPEGEGGIHQLTLSPTIKYAGSEQFAHSIEFRDPKTRKSYKAQVAFQVCVKPGSYKIVQDLVGDNERYDLKFTNNEIAWQTKEKGATTICALLVKVV